MSFFKCCVGADPRPSQDDVRPVSTTLSRRGGAHSAFASDGGASKRKMKLPTEVFFDPTKPDGQLSSVTDPTTSMREVNEMKKRRDTRDRTSRDGNAVGNGGGSRKLSIKVNIPDDSHNNLSSINNNIIINRHSLQPQQLSQQQLQQQQQKLQPRTSSPHHKTDLDAQDNNGLTRGQNFMKVEKWLRNSALYKQVDIIPTQIKNIEDSPAEPLIDNIADPPSEKDRLPPALVNHNSSSLPAPSR